MVSYGEVVLKLCPAKSPIETIACIADSQKLIVGQVASNEKSPTLSILDISSGGVIKVIEEADDYDNTIWRLVVDKNDRYLIYLKQVYNRYHILVNNMETEAAQTLMEVENSAEYKGFIISPNNEIVMGIGNTVQFFDVEENKPIKLIVIDEPKTIIGDSHCFTSLAFSPNGNLLAIGGFNKGEVLLYDLQEERIINRLLANFDYPREIVFDPAGKYIFVLDYWTQGMFIWKQDTYIRHEDTLFNERWRGINCIDFDPKNPRNVVMGMNSSIVKVVDIEDPKEIFKDEMHKGRVYNVSFTPDGKKLISSGEDGQIIVRNVE